MQMTKLIIFDLDGTLFRTETVDVKAFNRALALNGFSMKTSKEILSLMGLVLEEVCQALLNSGDGNLINKFKKDVIRFEDEEISTSGELYPGVLDFLNRLKSKGYKLCICSNGNKEYVNKISEKFNFNSIFDEIWYASEGISKAQAIKILKDKFNSESFIMVGDRTCDIDAAKENLGISIGAAYGYGENEADCADYFANSIEDVEEIIYSLHGIKKF